MTFGLPGVVEVDGCRIAYQERGPAGAPVVVLIHGGAAHAGWWNDVIPALDDRVHVVTLDLSGHGDSDHRPAYNAEVWAADVSAVIEAVSDRPVALVGHSMGGLVSVATAARRPHLVRALVLVDSRLPLRGLDPPPPTVRLFDSAEQALDRFRLLPAQTTADPARLRLVAREGLTQTDGGWRWKFDPGVRRRLTNDGVTQDLHSVSCGVGYLYGEHSDMGGPTSLDHLSQALGRPVPHQVVANSFHHVPLDQPRGCAEAIGAMLALLG